MNPEMMNLLRDRYTPDPIPPCVVCGAPLHIASMGGGNATQWACSAVFANGHLKWGSPEGDAQSDHWARSKFYQSVFRDGQVVALCDSLERVNQLTDDLARWKNLDGIEVAQKIREAITGELEQSDD